MDMDQRRLERPDDRIEAVCGGNGLEKLGPFWLRTHERDPKVPHAVGLEPLGTARMVPDLTT
jgi:hypothetical protein